MEAHTSLILGKCLNILIYQHCLLLLVISSRIGRLVFSLISL